MRACTVPLTIVALLAVPFAAAAHGVNAHMYVTDRAIDLLPDGDLKTMLSDPAVRPAAQIGALFPDTGYAAGAPYGEPAHWEPFATTVIAYLKETFGTAPYDTETAKVVAFFFGALTHGMEDEIFDSLFLPAAEEHDAKSQDVLDTACDAFLIASGKTDLNPPAFIPYAHAIEVFSRMGVAATQDEMDAGMEKTKKFAVEAIKGVALDMARSYREDVPWSYRHYHDGAIAGSFVHEMDVVAPFLEFTWRRLQGTLGAEDAFVARFPRDGEPLRSTLSGETASWVSIFTGEGMDDRDLTADRITLAQAAAPVPADVARTHWSNGQGSSRLFIVKPGADLALDTEYTVAVAPGLRLADGRTLSVKYSIQFFTACDLDGGACDDAGPDAGSPPADAGPLTPDAGSPSSDAGSTADPSAEAPAGSEGGCSCSAILLR